MKKQTLIGLSVILLMCCLSKWSYSQEINPVTVGKDRITYRLGESDTYLRLLPAALPMYVDLIQMPFDLFPAWSDPEIKAELISTLNGYNPNEAGLNEKKFYLQNLAHLVLLDIDNVSKWKNDYGNSLESLCSDRRLADQATLVRKLINDYALLYLPAIQKKKQ